MADNTERKVVQCKGCEADIIWIEYLGKKHPIDAKPKRGFIFIQDEYGHDVGTVEMAAIHESHLATCPKADKLRKEKKKPTQAQDDDGKVESTGVEPLGEDDVREEVLTLGDGSTIELNQQMRSNRESYAQVCANATSRKIVDGDGEGYSIACFSDKCTDNLDGRCLSSEDKRGCEYRTGAE